MKTFNIIIICLALLWASLSDARRDPKALGRFSQDDSSYDYRRREMPQNSPEDELSEMQDKGGLIIKGFPEGCAYASIDEALPDHILGFGRIDFMGSSFVFQYRDRSRPGPFSTAEVATNIGLMGQNPEQNTSLDLMSRTAQDRFVVAQLLDRSELGLAPIVTCISPIFRGTISPDRPIMFGQDYWSEYERFRDYRKEIYRSDRWKRWKHRWMQDEEYNWRKVRHPVFRPRQDHERVFPHGDRDKERYKDGYKDGYRARDRDKEKSKEKYKDRDKNRDKNRDRENKKEDVSAKPLPIKKPQPKHEEAHKINIQLPDVKNNPKNRMHIELQGDKKAPKERINIELQDDNKSPKKHIHIELPNNDNIIGI